MIEHFSLPSSFDQLPLDVLIMAPSHPKGIVQFSHGMCEHKERYMDFMSFLNKHGYICCIHDHRGHGKSIYKEEDLGYFYENGDIGIVEDLHQLTSLIKKRYPNLPLYLLGHSMGSLVVRCYIKKYDNDINGLFVIGSPSYNSAALFGVGLTSLYSKIKSDHYRPKLIQKIGFDAFNKNFNHDIENSWICSDIDVVSTYNHDPLCHFSFTANGFSSLFKLMNETYSKENWQVKQPKLPILFLAGENDPCITNEKKFNEAVTLIKDVGYQQVSFQLFKNMQHEILNEKNKKIVYHSILKTIKSWENSQDFIILIYFFASIIRFATKSGAIS